MERHDYLALDWVKGEIQETLNQAQQALEAFVATPGDVSRMRFCQTWLHQVYGTLQMVEFYGAALLAEEMEKLAQALLDGRVPATALADAQETLMRAILQLPPYLERVQASRRDLPVVLLPLMNDLRAARGESLLSETSLFKPDLDPQRAPSGKPSPIALDPRFPELARKIRQNYQMALLGLIRNQEPARQLTVLARVLEKLEQVTGQAAHLPLWQAAAALVEGVAAQVIPLGSSVKQLLGQLDPLLRRLAAEGPDLLVQAPDTDLLKNLLYYVAKSQAATPRIRVLRERFALDEALPSEELVRQEQAALAGPDQDALVSVVRALSEELSRVKAALELHLRERQPSRHLADQIQVLKQVADTVAMLGLGKPRQLVEEQMQVLEAMAAGQRAVSAEALMDVAGSLLYVEATLVGMTTERRAPTRRHLAAVPDHVGRAQDAVIRECRAGLEEAKDGIIEYIASQWDKSHLLRVPSRLDTVRGGLQVIQMERPALILRQCVAYVGERLLAAEAPAPEWRAMDTLADALTGVEYYLERLADDPDTSDDILLLARESVASLGYPISAEEFGLVDEDAIADDPDQTPQPPVEVDGSGEREPPRPDASIVARVTRVEDGAVSGLTEPPSPVDEAPADDPAPVPAQAGPETADEDADDLIDDEIIEIFVEEAGEVLETLDLYFPRWVANQSDQEALVEFRRAFHTLKGSGRMVGATLLGELAWSVENMMNRVIDGTIVATPQLIELVRQVHGRIPALVQAFARRQPAPFDVTPLQEAAHRLASGGTLDALPDVAPVEGDGRSVAEALPVLSDPQEDVAHGVPDRSGETQPQAAPTPAVVPVLQPLPLLEEPLETLDGDLFALSPEAASSAWSPRPVAEVIAASPSSPEPLPDPPLVAAESMQELPEQQDADLVSDAPESWQVEGTLPEDMAAEALHAWPADPLDLLLEDLPAEDSIEAQPWDGATARPEEAAGGRPPSGAEPPQVEPDPVLLELFRAESQANIQIIRAWLQGLDPDLSEQPVDDAVHRAMHTLKGSARMAGVQPVAQLAEPVEKYLKTLINQHRPLEQQGWQCVAALTDRIAAQVEAPAPLEDDDRALLRRLDGCQAQLERDTTHGRAAVLSVFMSDGMDLIVEAEQHLEQWLADGAHPEGLRPLRHELALLSASAAGAHLMDVSVMASLLGELCAAVMDGRQAVNSRLVTLARQGHEALLSMMDCLAAGQTLRSAPELVQQLRELVDAAHGGGAGDHMMSLAEPVGTAEHLPRDPADAGALLVGSVAEGEPSMHSGDLTDRRPAAVTPTERGELDVTRDEDPGCRNHDSETAADAGLGLLPDPVETPFADSSPAMVEPLTGGDPDGESLRPSLQLDDLLQDLDETAVPAQTVPDGTTVGASASPAAAGAALPAWLDEPGPERDQDLLDIFLEEADELLESIGDQLDRWMADPANLIAVQTLQRDLHTLKGGARMAEVPELGDLGHELENLYEGLAQGRLQATPLLFELLHRCHDRLADLLQGVRQQRRLCAATDLIADIGRYVADPEGFTLTPLAGQGLRQPPAEVPAAAGPAAVALDDDLDLDILRIFIEESSDLAELIEEQAGAWRETGQVQHLDEVRRALHTLKGGARLAGLKTLGDLTHDFEAWLLGECPDGAPLSGDAQVRFLEWMERLSEHLQAVRSQVPQAPARPQPPAEVRPAAPAAGTETAPAEREGGRDARTRRPTPPQEMVRVASELLENLVNLAGETSINRGRVEQSISDFTQHVEEMGHTIDRLYEQLRRLDAETEAQILSTYRQGLESGEYDEAFDPLEMDQYSNLHQITKQLSESASDLRDLKSTLLDRSRDTETLLLQQARINTELQEKLMRTRMVPFARLVPRLRRIVRQVAGEVGKQVELEILNPDGELDRTLMEHIVAPLEHMLRNALDHGIETPEQRLAAGKPAAGRIELSLTREGGEVVLTLQDDGQGVNTEAVRRKAIERGLLEPDREMTEQDIQQFLFAAGFSTATRVTQLSGRGVGLDVVASGIKQMGGSVSVSSQPGAGTRFIVRLPFTLAMNRALMVRLGEDLYAIPLNQIEGIVRVSPFELADFLGDTPRPFVYAGQQYDFSYLGAHMHGVERPLLEAVVAPMPVLLIRSSEHTVALAVDALLGSREVVVKSVGPQLATVPGLSGATILGDGSVVIILDIHSLIRASQLQRQLQAVEQRRAALVDQAVEALAGRRRTPLIMVTDDSVTVRKVTSRLLERNGFDVVTAKDGLDALARLDEQKPDLMLLDIEMPRMDGFEVATHVRHDARLQDIPIIMITSRTGEKHRERALEIGVDRYLGKPYQESELLETVRELLARQDQSEMP